MNDSNFKNSSIKTLGVYVDVQNIYYTVKQQYNAHFNYKEFLSEVKTGGRILKAVAYATNNNREDQRHFQGLLASYGFQVQLSSYNVHSSGQVSMEREMRSDILHDSRQLDRIILATGNGGFEDLIHHIKRIHQRPIDLYGVPGLTAQRLIDAVDQYFPIDASLLLGIPIRW
ncbi:MAG: nuclease [Verrucomicrobia bacterium]|nr:MAG: nuclease [Verrucomicrobiota bacterium]